MGKRENRPAKLAATHPGQVLREDFMKPLGITQNQLGRDLGISPRRINEIVHGKRRVTADTALRLARHIGTTPQFWMNLQSQHDLALAEDALAGRLEKEVRVRERVA